MMDGDETYLVALKGHPATGKSTLATALARRWKWPLLDKDDIKDHTLEFPDANDRAYAILWQMVATQLQLGVSVIVDSPLAYPYLYERAKQVAAVAQAQLLVVETRLDETHWRQRLEERSPTASTHKIRGWVRMQEQLGRYNGCWRYAIAPEHHLLINTAQPLDDLVAVVQQRLRGS
ncbi:MAG TPA: AAA family ATPase [Caldilineaceae bacterium]|nr:AAA family ATPase [Caldilineaceae bacterium]